MYLREISKDKPPRGGGGGGGGGGLILEEGRFNGRLFAYEFGGLIHGGAYFQNFMVCVLVIQTSIFLTSYRFQINGKKAFLRTLKS